MNDWPTPTIRVRQLDHFYGEGESRNQVLRNNHLEIGPGEIVIMTGPSGSGKTTLLTLVGGLRSVQEGSVQVLGRELAGMDRKALVQVRREIGFIFQAHNLFDSLTAHQNVKMALELTTADTQVIHRRATEILTDLGLGQRIHYKPRSLSGGQKQRVAIARALANRPRLILADEPTAALDERSGRDVVDLLRRLASEEQCTCLLVTHDNRILDVADRIVTMVSGEIHSNVLVAEALAICEFLSRCPTFKGLPPETFTNVAEKVVKERYPTGAVIIRQGEEGDKFYLVRKGSVDVLVEKGGTERSLAILTEGDFFGEHALLTGERRNATIRAREDVETYTLSKADFEAALAASAPIREQLLRVYSQRQ